MRSGRVSKGRAPIYQGKAEEFLRAASDALARGHWNAVGLASVHAGISAADAACTWILGERSRDPDHETAASLMRRIPRKESPDRAEQFVQLVREKHVIEYEARLYEADEAAAAFARATRLVEWSRAILRGPAD